jgi:2-polyprenyl-3-methyl-5-hydroxy-6-metoxy-1,4-benzoquinol methylase
MSEKKLQCKVCGNADFNQYYIGKEMNFGMGDEFTYFQCAKCRCLQITEIPDDMGKYYPENYYSFHFNEEKRKTKIANYLMKNAIQSRMEQFRPVGWLARLYNKYYRESYFYLTKKQFNYNSKVLDVGCGTGIFLLQMYSWGFRNLTGIDPYLKEDIIYADTVKLYKKEIFDVEEKYDLIRLNHSFEHMPDPTGVFSKLAELLEDKGLLVISIPVGDCYLWRKYKMNWYQVDVPRHFFLHTVNSIAYLAKTNGLRVKEIRYEAKDESTALCSECYAREDKNYPFTRKTRQAFRKKTQELDLLQDGDQACFVLEKCNK